MVLPLMVLLLAEFRRKIPATPLPEIVLPLTDTLPTLIRMPWPPLTGEAALLFAIVLFLIVAPEPASTPRWSLFEIVLLSRSTLRPRLTPIELFLTVLPAPAAAPPMVLLVPATLI